jgi:hypothetical protein
MLHSSLVHRDGVKLSQNLAKTKPKLSPKTQELTVSCPSGVYSYGNPQCLKPPVATPLPAQLGVAKVTQQRQAAKGRRIINQAARVETRSVTARQSPVFALNELVAPMVSGDTVTYVCLSGATAQS